MIKTSQDTGKLFNSKDWNHLGMGDVTQWPQSLLNSLRLLFNSKNPMFIFWGREALCFYNDGYIPILGTDKHPHAMGALAKDVWPETWEHIIKPQLKTVLDDGESTWNLDQYIPLKRNGKMVEGYFSNGYSPIFLDDGSVGGAFIIAVETTASAQALKESEARFKQIALALPQLVWTCKPDGQCDYLSKQWEDYTGMKQGEQLGLDWLDKVIHPEDRQRTFEHWMGAVNGLHPYDIEYRIRRHDGVYRWFKTRGTRIENEKGEVSNWFGTCTDIEELKLAISARDEFLSIASHELKTPLTSLKIQAQLHTRAINKNLPTAYAPEVVNELVEQTERQVDRITRLVDDMLDVSRIRSGNLKLKPETFNVCEAIKDCIHRLEVQFQKATYEVPIVEKCEHAIGTWDRMRIEQVITNLLTNAIRYGNKKPISINVEANKERVKFSVHDHGLGIAEDAKEKIFDRFERAINATEVSGLGLGLFITKQIVTAHGGRIWVESQLGKGSTFTVELPTVLPESNIEKGISVV